MELTNYKTYKKEMERIGYDADMTLDMIERWASECDGSYGSRDIHYCDHYHHDFVFDLVRPAYWEICDEATDRRICVDKCTNCVDLKPGTYIGNVVIEPIYRFRK